MTLDVGEDATVLVMSSGEADEVRRALACYRRMIDKTLEKYGEEK